MFILLSIILGIGSVNAATPSAPETAIKGAYVYNFGKFTDWPDTAFSSPADPVRLCIYDGGQISTELEVRIKNKTIHNRPLSVKAIQQPHEVSQCHILYINTPDPMKNRQALNATEGFPVLTVGDSQAFVRDGGCIRLYQDEKRIGFEINLAALDKKGLKMSSRLLRLAKVMNVDAVQ